MALKITMMTILRFAGSNYNYQIPSQRIVRIYKINNAKIFPQKLEATQLGHQAGPKRLTFSNLHYITHFDRKEKIEYSYT